jgi:hypothetical protein
LSLNISNLRNLILSFQIAISELLYTILITMEDFAKLQPTEEEHEEEFENTSTEEYTEEEPEVETNESIEGIELLEEKKKIIELLDPDMFSEYGNRQIKHLLFENTPVSLDESHRSLFLASTIMEMDADELRVIKDIMRDDTIQQIYVDISDTITFLNELNERSNSDYSDSDVKRLSKKINEIYERFILTTSTLFPNLKVEIDNHEKSRENDIGNDTVIENDIKFLESILDKFQTEMYGKHPELQKKIADQIKSASDFELKRFGKIWFITDAMKSFFRSKYTQNSEIIQQVFKKTLKDKKIFEIGGSAMKKGFEQYGSNAIKYDDTDFSWSGWERGGKKLENTMNSQNYVEVLDKIDPNDPDHQYDLTVSRMLFDRGSGIEYTVESQNYEEATAEVLKVLAATTKTASFSIHFTGDRYGNFFDKNDEEKLKELGFEKVLVTKGIGEYIDSASIIVLRRI